MYILYMLVLNNTPFVHPRVYLQYFNSALPGGISYNENKINIYFESLDPMQTLNPMRVQVILTSLQDETT